MVGKTEAQARKLITDAGFQPSVVHDSTTKAKKGTVLEQSPSAGNTQDKGSTVTIVVSTYVAPTPTPPPTTPAPTTPAPTTSTPTPPSP